MKKGAYGAMINDKSILLFKINLPYLKERKTAQDFL